MGYLISFTVCDSLYPGCRLDFDSGTFALSLSDLWIPLGYRMHSHLSGWRGEKLVIWRPYFYVSGLWGMECASTQQSFTFGMGERVMLGLAIMMMRNGGFI